MAPFDPKGKTFQQRLDALIADAKSTYKVTVRVSRTTTTPQWQQKYHVAHMFVYNKYKTQKPANVEPGARTIAWSHFSDPKVVWNTVLWTDFLRTKTGSVPVKQGQTWATGSEPDRAKTIEHVKLMLKTAGIGLGGSAQVSCGISPCGEPCRCKVGATRHLSGKAADLNSADLKTLAAALARAKAGTLDAYLGTFGLHRPLLKHPTSPEEWHVESKP
jgi:hypothetical protein